MSPRLAVFACVLMLASSVGTVHAVEAFRVEKITVEFPETPKGGGGGGKPKTDAMKAKDWVEIEVEYQLDPDDYDPQDPYLDAVQVKVHLFTPPPRSKAKEDKPELYTLTLDYTQVEAGKRQYAVAYIPPQVVDRLGGSTAFRSREKCNYAAEVFVGGKAVASKEFNKRAGEEGWFSKGGGKTGLLLPISKTPWAMDYWRRYPLLLKAE
jgi:hypothetical protein